jgi:hypothetical protein
VWQKLFFFPFGFGNQTEILELLAFFGDVQGRRAAVKVKRPGSLPPMQRVSSCCLVCELALDVGLKIHVGGLGVELFAEGQ